MLGKSEKPSRCVKQALFSLVNQIHPEPSSYKIPPNIFERINSYEVNTSAREAFEISGAKVRGIIRQKSSKVSPGIDGLRWEHLLALLGQGRPEIQTENIFADLLANIIILIIDVKEVAPDVYDFLRLNKLVAIPKPDGSIRPLGMGSTIRKLCSCICFTQTFSSHPDFNGDPFNLSYFKGLQFGVDKQGCEKIIHNIHHHMQLCPTDDVL